MLDPRIPRIGSAEFWADVFQGTLKKEFWEQGLRDGISSGEFTPELAEEIRKVLELPDSTSV